MRHGGTRNAQIGRQIWIHESRERERDGDKTGKKTDETSRRRQGSAFSRGQVANEFIWRFHLEHIFVADWIPVTTHLTIFNARPA